jgi:hypothetical protein
MRVAGVRGWREPPASNDGALAGCTERSEEEAELKAIFHLVETRTPASPAAPRSSTPKPVRPAPVASLPFTEHQGLTLK